MLVPALLLVAALPQSVSAPPVTPMPKAPSSQDDPKEIVVTGRRLEDTAAALAACIARHCPTDQDVDATIEHAQGQMLAGDYSAARRTLADSLTRNKGQAKAYPKPVSDLYLVQSRVSLHLGEAQFARGESMRSLRALRAGLADNDTLIFSQRLEYADVRARVGGWETAIEMYRQIERDARAEGQIEIATYAKFKLAVLYGALAERDAIFAISARQHLLELGNLTDPRLKAFVNAAAVLAAQLRIRGNKGPSLDELIARNTNSPSLEPVLLKSPPITLYSERPRDGSVTLQLTSDADYADQWVNIGFRVKSDGTVDDVQMLDRSSALRDWWVGRVTTSIQGRRYAPLTPEQALNAVRVERYTITSFWGNVTGSHVRVRTPRPYVQALDITPRASLVASR